MLFSMNLFSENTQRKIINLNDKKDNPDVVQNIIPEPAVPFAKPSLDKKYVVFNNFDPAFFDAVYGKILAGSQYVNDFLSAQFSDSFFEQYKITDFDVAIFPLGNFVLNAKTQSGTNIVMQKIKNLLDSGKQIIITSRTALLGAYNDPNGIDPLVKSFLEQKLGIKYIGWRPTCDTSGTNVTFAEFVAKGDVKDPISIGSRKECNVVFNGQPPLAYYYNTDVFESKDNNTYSPVDHFILKSTDLPTDTLVGIKAEVGKSKVVFWSIGFEVMCQENDRKLDLLGAMNWVLRQPAKAGPNIEALEETVYFSNTDVKDSSFADVVVRNAGTQTLKIDKIEIENFADKGVFTINSKPQLPALLNPDAFITVNVKFVPKEKRDYIEFLDFTSNSVDKPIYGVQLNGSGGTGTAPILTVNNDTINFGEVELLKKAYFDLLLTNTGTQELYVNLVNIINDTDKRFNFVFGKTSNVVLPPNAKDTIRLSFVPQDTNTYEAKLKILSTSKIAPEMYIVMTGKGKASAPNDVPEIKAASGKFIELKASPNPFTDKTKIEYKITGSSPMDFELYLIDINGSRILDLLNKKIEPGEYSTILENSNLPNGKYFIIGKSGSYRAELPVVITK